MVWPVWSALLGSRLALRIAYSGAAHPSAKRRQDEYTGQSLIHRSGSYGDIHGRTLLSTEYISSNVRNNETIKETLLPSDERPRLRASAPPYPLFTSSKCLF
ncbi:uncharacterized protein EV420DRAFT_1040538 [Desarmillaria tabescens]|uniref:Secreted protein n=1 Tax=Armillaria tabescens TaxID=1929756 RepID=A0AA39NF02_ARMTA|nr:uncharacterized protein EV420DRAFT_1040538 [Desarmillaria tabescens]KAK0464405.1 hypothetical protein EV420DRAFT_1040538 [Desarmillaria tabescens]